MRLRRPTVSRETLRKIARAKSLKLDIGCGAHVQPGCFGLDQRPLPGVDLVLDLEHFPWPLPDNCARVAFMSHFWEHIKPWRTIGLMAELHRVLQHDAQVLISSPYGMEFRFIQDPTHCFGPETEVLTTAGFRAFEDVREGDTCVVLDPETMAVTNSPVIKTIAQPYVGHLLHFQTKRMDLLVTPNHDLLSSANNLHPVALERHRADYLQSFQGHHSRRAYGMIPGWVGQSLDTFKVPFVPRGGNNAGKKMPVEFPAIPFVRFMGWFLSEGSLCRTPSQYVIQIHQSRTANPSKYREIVETVLALGLTPNERVDAVRCSSKDLWTYLDQFGLSGDKFIPTDLKQLAPPLLENLLDTLVKGDGSVNGRGRDYASVSYQFAADVQEIALKCGYRAQVNEELRETQQVINGSVVNCRPVIYRVGIFPEADSYYPKPVEVPFTGTVRCATVAEHHTLLVRRNGRATWAGNCNPSNEATFAYWDPLHESGLWGVYQPPVFHLESFDVIPAGASRDFNAILRACKPVKGKLCPHGAA